MKILKWFGFVVIALLLIFIGLPNPIPPYERAKISSVKANMHTLQTTLETYAVDWKGFYPDTIEQLEKEATKQKYYKNLKNPFTGDKGISNITFNDLNPFPDKKYPVGKIFYKAVRDKKNTIGYYLYGVDKNGEFILDKGDFFILRSG